VIANSEQKTEGNNLNSYSEFFVFIRVCLCNFVFYNVKKQPCNYRLPLY